MSGLTSLLAWLDRYPPRYWSCVWITLSVVVISALGAYFAPRRSARWNHPALFAAAIGLAILAFRWPVVFDNEGIFNPDEGHVLAGALALSHDPVPWRSIDGMTHGPLDLLPLVVMERAGIRLDYTNARLLAAFLIWLTVVFTWLTLRQRFGDGLGRMLVLPFALFVITTRFADFVLYSTEHVPIALLAAAVWLLTGATLPLRSDRPWRLGLAGLCLGAAPWAKLQSAPIALWLGVMGVAFVLLDKGVQWPTRARLATWLIGGALVVPVTIAGVVLVNGAWHDFWVCYVKANIYYTEQMPMDWSTALPFFRRLAIGGESYTWFFWGHIIVLAGALILRLFWARTDEWRFLVLSLGLLVVSLYTVLAPNRTFMHYLHFSFTPVVLATGAALGSLVLRAERKLFVWRGIPFRPLAWLLLIAFFAKAAWPVLLFPLNGYSPPLGTYGVRKGKLARSDVAGLVLTVTKPNESIVVWGWEPRYYVESNRRPGIREGETEREMFDSPFRDYYRERMVKDFERSNSPVFIDVVGRGTFYFEDRLKYAHETFPALAALIAQRYRFIAEMGNVRIYLRNDRPFNPPVR
jgi:hypothetical protein